MSLAWTTAARGGRVIPCVLIAGIPVVLVPEGIALTGWTAGGLDGAWWPGSSFSGFSAYIRAWLSLSQPVTWSERAQPVQPELLDVSALDIRVSDIGLRADGTGGLATALFAQQDDLVGSWITADVSTAATTVSVASTAGFPASGFLYLGRETMAYTSTTSTSFAVGSAANRGRFGSPVQHHWFTGDGNAAIANPQVTSGPPEIIGRTATVWLLEVSPAGVVTAGELAFYGSVGTGVVLSDDGEAWTLRIDHLIRRLTIPLRGETVNVSGYTHNAPEGNRGPGSVNGALQAWCPTYDYAENSSRDLVNVYTLTRAAAAPDNGGWHADAESYVRDLSLATSTAGHPAARYSLQGDGKLRIVTDLSPTDTLTIGWPWDRGRDFDTLSAGTTFYLSGKPFPAAWVPVFSQSRVYLNASDYARVPVTPSFTGATVYYALACEGANDRINYARITSKASGSGLYWVVCDAVERDPSLVDTLGLIAPGFIITEPVAARVVCYVRADDWITAIEALVESFDTSLAETLSDAFDFTDMRAVVARFPEGPYARAREYVVDLTESVLDVLVRECRLNGYCLTLKSGRISIVRVADFAQTEETTASLSTADLHAEHPLPSYARGLDGIVNAVSISAPEPLNITVNVVDATSLSAYGAGRSRIEVRAPRQVGGTVVNPAAEYLRLAAQAMQILGPIRYPYETLTITTPAHKLGIGVGDLVAATLWRVPDQSAARGITSAVVQIVGREPALYDDGDARVTFTARMSPRNIRGWAPSALVAGAGISGANITLDTTTFGAAGFAPSGTDGGATWFEVDDVVRLVQIGTTSPTASTQHTVTGVSGAVVTVTPAPNATFTGLAGTPLTVLVIADDWSAASVNQKRFAYLAGAGYLLNATDTSKVYAA